MEHYLGLPPDGSVHGPQIDNLIGLVHWLMFLLFAGWGTYFVVTLIRFRSSKGRRANYHGVKSHVSTYLEVAVIVVEAVLLVVFSIPIWSERVDAFPSEQGSTVVRIVAEQFAWNIHYPGADGVFGKTSLSLVGTDNPLGLDRNDPAAKDDITTINQLNLPAGRPVIIHLTSKDVIHSLNLPAYRVKQDAVPGLSIPVWFEPVKTSAAIRDEMAAAFSVSAAAASATTLALPAPGDVTLVKDAARDGYLLTADAAGKDGSALLSAGDELNLDNVNLLVDAGVTTVRARAAAGLEKYVSLESVADAAGSVLLPVNETVSEEAVTALVNTGIMQVKARKKSFTDPWVLNEQLSARDGSAIGAPGDYLTEEIITRAAEAGIASITVAPSSPTEIACAQLCGLGHYRMRGYMEVQTPEEFQTWFDEQLASVREQYGSPSESAEHSDAGEADATAGTGDGRGHDHASGEHTESAAGGARQ